MAANDNWHMCPGQACSHGTVFVPQYQFWPTPPQHPQAIMGWECPRCHAVHAPSVLSCSCEPGGTETPGAVTETPGSA